MCLSTWIYFGDIFCDIKEYAIDDNSMVILTCNFFFANLKNDKYLINNNNTSWCQNHSKQIIIFQYGAYAVICSLHLFSMIDNYWNIVVCRVIWNLNEFEISHEVDETSKMMLSLDTSFES